MSKGISKCLCFVWLWVVVEGGGLFGWLVVEDGGYILGDGG